MTDIGELVVRIKADAAQLDREMRRANGIVQQKAGAMEKSFGRLRAEVLSLAPALSAVAFAGFARSAFAAADRLNDLALRTGVAGSTLSALEVPLKQSGSSVDDLSTAMVKLNNTLGEAVSSKEAARNFEAIGLSVADLLAQSPEQRLFSVAKAVNAIGDESAQTNGLLGVMGRGAGTLLPLFKELGGDLDALVKKQKALGNAITDADLRKIDAFGDALTANIHAAQLVTIQFLELIGSIPKALAEVYLNRNLPAVKVGSVSYLRPDVPSDRDLAKGVSDSTGLANKDDRADTERKRRAAEAAIAAARAKAAGEETAKTTKAGRQALDEYTESLARQNAVLRQTPREQAALEAGYKTTDLARKAGIRDAAALIAANQDLVRTNYDLAESMQQAARFQQVLHDKLAATLTDIAFKADSAGASMLAFAESIAKAAFEKRVAGPLADALIGSGGNTGLLDGAVGFLGSQFGGWYADGGRPPMGRLSVVGERGPEIFVPDTAGTIVPNHALGGTTVIVQQTIQVNPGVPELINARIRESAPVIAAQAQAATLMAMRQGGDASRVIGARS